MIGKRTKNAVQHNSHSFTATDMTSEYVPPESLVTDSSDLVLELSTSDDEKRHFYFKDFLCEFYIIVFLESFHECGV